MTKKQISRASLSCGPAQAASYMQMWSPKERRETMEQRQIFEEVMAEIFPNLVKNVSIQI